MSFVDSDEFLALLVSSRPLERSDDRDAEVLGLCDRDTGQRYLIEEERIPAPARDRPGRAAVSRDAAS